MTPEEKQAKLKEMNDLLERVTAIDLERHELEKKLKEVMPIKEGDKVMIVNTDTDEFIRYAYAESAVITKAKHNSKSRFTFKLMKCRKGGAKSQHSDHLKYRETIARIKP